MTRKSVLVQECTHAWGLGGTGPTPTSPPPPHLRQDAVSLTDCPFAQFLSLQLSSPLAEVTQCPDDPETQTTRDIHSVPDHILSERVCAPAPGVGGVWGGRSPPQLLGATNHPRMFFRDEREERNRCGQVRVCPVFLRGTSLIALSESPATAGHITTAAHRGRHRFPRSKRATSAL